MAIANIGSEILYPERNWKIIEGQQNISKHPCLIPNDPDLVLEPNTTWLNSELFSYNESGKLFELTLSNAVQPHSVKRKLYNYGSSETGFIMRSERTGLFLMWILHHSKLERIQNLVNADRLVYTYIPYCIQPTCPISYLRCLIYENL